MFLRASCLAIKNGLLQGHHEHMDPLLLLSGSFLLNFVLLSQVSSQVPTCRPIEKASEQDYAFMSDSGSSRRQREYRLHPDSFFCDHIGCQISLILLRLLKTSHLQGAD